MAKRSNVVHIAGKEEKDQVAMLSGKKQRKLTWVAHNKVDNLP
jgi:hypothetical protein